MEKQKETSINPKPEGDNKEDKPIVSEKTSISAEELEKILSGETECKNEMTTYFRDQILLFRTKFQNEHNTLKRIEEERGRLNNEADKLTETLKGYGSRLQGLVHDLNHWL